MKRNIPETQLAEIQNLVSEVVPASQRAPAEAIIRAERNNLLAALASESDPQVCYYAVGLILDAIVAMIPEEKGPTFGERLYAICQKNAGSQVCSA